MANRFDNPVLYGYVSQYVPIPFEELYTVARDNARKMDEAYNLLSNNIKEWSKFTSPSQIDTENYNALTIGAAKDIVEELASNPDMLKTTDGRRRIQQFINSRPYGELAKMEQTRQNALARNALIAKMEAEGKYAEWMDDPRFTSEGLRNWDTSSSGIMNDLSPIQFQDLQEIGSPYIKGIKPTFYQGANPNNPSERLPYTNWMAVTENDIRREFLPHVGDIISTPQGNAWYNRIAKTMKAINPNITAEEVNEAFVDALVARQSKEIHSKPIVDQASLTRDMTAAKLAASGRKSGSGTGREIDGVPVTRQELITWDIVTNPNYSTKDRDTIIRDEFKRISGFDLEDEPEKNENYSWDGYRRGVKGALSKISSHMALNTEDGDTILTTLGGKYNTYTTSGGKTQKVYDFESSSGFVMPETVFSIMSDTNPASVERYDAYSSNEEFAIRQAIEAGRIQNVQFIPDSGNNVTQLEGQKVLSGKLLMPVAEVEKALGTAMGSWMPFSSQSTKSVILNEMDGREIQYGEDGEPYYSIDIYRALPEDNNTNYWNYTNNMDLKGIGGASFSSDNYYNVTGRSFIQ